MGVSAYCVAELESIIIGKGSPLDRSQCPGTPNAEMPTPPDDSQPSDADKKPEGSPTEGSAPAQPGQPALGAPAQGAAAVAPAEGVAAAAPAEGEAVAAAAEGEADIPAPDQGQALEPDQKLGVGGGGDDEDKPEDKPEPECNCSCWEWRCFFCGPKYFGFVLLLGLYWIVVGVLLGCYLPPLWHQLYTPNQLPGLLVNPPAVVLRTTGTATPPASEAFTASIPGDADKVKMELKWSMSGDPSVTGTLDPKTGQYTAPSLSHPGASHISVRAEDSNAPERNASATVILSGTSLGIVPAYAVAGSSQVIPFSIAQNSDGVPFKNPVWSVDPNLGHVTQDGVYTAPATIDRAQMVTVMVSSTADPTLAASANVMLSAPPGGSTPEQSVDLLYLALLVGALGGYLHALGSYVNFLGNRQFQASWFAWYLFRPIIGGVLAIVVFFVAAAGLLGGDNGAATAIRVAMLASLVGIFSDQALLKLADLVNVIFPSTADNLRKGKLTDGGGVSITSTVPSTWQASDQAIVLHGTNFADGCTVLVNDVKVTPTNPSNISLTVPLSDAAKTEAFIKIKVTNPSGCSDVIMIAKGVTPGNV